VPVQLLVHHVDFGPASFPAAASAPAFRQDAARTYSAARPTSSSTRAARTSAWIRNSAIMGPPRNWLRPLASAPARLRSARQCL
jgi:hypothetical protein